MRLKNSNLIYLPDIQDCLTKFLLGCLLALVVCELPAQSVSNLKAKKKQLLEDIKITNKRLSKTKKSKKAALARITQLKTNITNRSTLISTIEHEILKIDSSVIRHGEVIESLEEDIGKLKHEYGAMLRRVNRQQIADISWMYILSADGFNEGIRRWQYFRQYNNYRKKQTRLILDTQDMLERKILRLKEDKITRQELLSESVGQQEKLSVEINGKNKIIASLKDDESRLKKELSKNQRRAQQLDDSINDIILLSIANAKQKKKKANASLPTTPVISEMSKKFSANKGKLPWPVAKGVVARYFGKQEHPTIKRIYVKNNGIDISAEMGAAVRSVFDGEISGVQVVPGFGKVVIIEHGSFYTVYSNLSSVFVNKGDRVKTLEEVGMLMIDESSNTSMLHFEIWNQKNKVNPIKWISKKK